MKGHRVARVSVLVPTTQRCCEEYVRRGRRCLYRTVVSACGAARGRTPPRTGARAAAERRTPSSGDRRSEAGWARQRRGRGDGGAAPVRAGACGGRFEILL